MIPGIALWCGLQLVALQCSEYCGELRVREDSPKFGWCCCYFATNSLQVATIGLPEATARKGVTGFYVKVVATPAQGGGPNEAARKMGLVGRFVLREAHVPIDAVYFDGFHHIMMTEVVTYGGGKRSEGIVGCLEAAFVGTKPVAIIIGPQLSQKGQGVGVKLSTHYFSFILLNDFGAGKDQSFRRIVALFQVINLQKFIYCCCVCSSTLFADTLRPVKPTSKMTMKPLWLYCCLLLFFSSSSISSPPVAERPASVQRYVQQYNYLAVTLSEQTGIPKPIIIAVAGLESNWGRSELAQLANNHFGIKIKPEWNGPQYCKYTEEYFWFEEYQPQQTMACFRKYPLIKESYQDFGSFVTTRPNYQNLLQAPSWNYRAWAEGLQLGGYATDPAYAQKILRLIWRYRLYEV
jgi:hypothetical protein